MLEPLLTFMHAQVHTYIYTVAWHHLKVVTESHWQLIYDSFYNFRLLISRLDMGSWVELLKRCCQTSTLKCNSKCVLSDFARLLDLLLFSGRCGSSMIIHLEDRMHVYVEFKH